MTDEQAKERIAKVRALYNNHQTEAKVSWFDILWICTYLERKIKEQNAKTQT